MADVPNAGMRSEQRQAVLICQAFRKRSKLRRRDCRSHVRPQPSDLLDLTFRAFDLRPELALDFSQIRLVVDKRSCRCGQITSRIHQRFATGEGPPFHRIPFARQGEVNTDSESRALIHTTRDIVEPRTRNDHVGTTLYAFVERLDGSVVDGERGAAVVSANEQANGKRKGEQHQSFFSASLRLDQLALR